MAEKDRTDEGPSLELPSLFGRRKKKADRAADEPAPSEGTATVVADPALDETDRLADEDDAEVASVPEPSPEPVVDTPPQPEPSATDVSAGPTSDAADRTEVIEPVAEPVVDTQPEPVVDTQPEPVVDTQPEPVVDTQPEPVVDTQPEPVVDTQPEPVVDTQPEPVVDTQPEPVVDTQPEPVVDTQPGGIEAPEPAPAAAKPAKPKVPVAERVQSSLPDLAGNTAAFVVGGMVGLVGCALTFAGLKGCELATSTDSCGGPGLLVLGAIVLVMILLGAALLRMFRVPEAGNLSFLGVGIMSVVTLVFLTEYLYDAWMFAAIPVLTAVSFSIARWVTTRYTDDGLLEPDRPEQHDIR